jgi:DNA-binding transcriptional ArsR family regulator
LRILALLAEAELTVSELTAILRQSQPRISRHLRLLMQAGLVDRFREGAWAFFRLAERGGAAELARILIARLDVTDDTIARDRERLAAVRAQRAASAQSYFRRHAAEWDRIRNLHVAEEAVEEAINAAMGQAPMRALLDLGTGTGRMLELFGPIIDRGLGLDLSLDMLAFARARLDRAGFCIFSTMARAPFGKLPACSAPRAACWSWTSRRTSSSSCAMSTPTAGLASPRRR